MADYEHFELDEVEGVAVLYLKDHDFFDRLVISELQDEMVDYVKNETPQKLLIHFGRVRAISSETINALLRTREWTQSNEGELKLCDMRDTIRSVFRVANLDRKIFEIHDSMHSALEAF